MHGQTDSKVAVYAALIGSVLIALSKFVAAAITGSSAILSEGVHSLVDATVELLLLYGIYRAGRPAIVPIHWATVASSISGVSLWPS